MPDSTTLSPVRLHEACDMLARAIVPVVGYDKAAVCVLDGDSTIVVMGDNCDDEQQTGDQAVAGRTRSSGPVVDCPFRTEFMATGRHRRRRSR